MIDMIGTFIQSVELTHPLTDLHFLFIGGRHYAAIATKVGSLPVRGVIPEKTQHLCAMRFAPVAVADTPEKARVALNEKLFDMRITHDSNYADYVGELWMGRYDTPVAGVQIKEDDLAELDSIDDWYGRLLSLHVVPLRHSAANGDYIAMLASSASGNYGAEQVTMAEEDFWVAILEAVPDFPLCSGTTPSKALGGLLKKLAAIRKTHLTDREALIKWVTKINKTYGELVKHDQYSMDAFKNFVSTQS